jgi:hypothetical protein
MLKKIMLVGLFILSFSSFNLYAGTLLASPGFVATGCNWNILSNSSYWPGVTVNVIGLFCNGNTNPVLVRVVVTQPGFPYGNGSSQCTMNASGGTELYTYSSPLTCTSYSVSTK